MSRQYVRTAPPKDYSERPGRAPFKLQRDWDPHGIKTPPPTDLYKAGHEQTFGRGPVVEYCPHCDLRPSWCNCAASPVEGVDP